MGRHSLFIADEFKKPLSAAGFPAESVFSHPDIIPWRKLKDRENCTWDLPTENGPIRLHVKRHFNLGAVHESNGIFWLESKGIPTVKTVASGFTKNNRSFTITQDLAGYQPADKLIVSKEVFEQLLIPTADMVAKLHNANLHHRDLYLCHFFAQIEKDKIDLRLIDAARVRPLPALLRQRWLIKDVAQFWFSTLSLPITDRQRRSWLERYAKKRGISKIDSLQKSIERKSASIGAHDVKLRKKQPSRNISIPGSAI